MLLQHRENVVAAFVVVSSPTQTPLGIPVSASSGSDLRTARGRLFQTPEAPSDWIAPSLSEQHGHSTAPVLGEANPEP